jgi:hypothetical protein
VIDENNKHGGGAVCRLHLCMQIDIEMIVEAADEKYDPTQNAGF